MLNQMLAAVNQDYPIDSALIDDAESAPALELRGDGEAKSCFPVATFSQSAIAVAVGELQKLCLQLWGQSNSATVNRELSAAWCLYSLRPVDWSLPASWDEYSGDYQCRDGWIRLHTNAAHHRKAALHVLGNPSNLNSAREAASSWAGLDLESAVVLEGGASAFMMNAAQWGTHEQGIAVSEEPVVAWRQLDGGGDYLNKAFTTPEYPLKGIRILDLTRVLAGPVCTRFLASAGAEVLRIDPPHWEEDGNAIEMTVGKRCAGLDLTTTSDRSIFEELLRSADVVVHGYRRNALEALGYGDSARLNINKNLIDVSLNAYGWTGPWKNRRGFDSLVQMSSGIAQAGQESFGGEKPVPLPYQALDHVTGYLMATAVIKAIREKAHSGKTLSARLSLARQAKLLQDLRESMSGTPDTGYYEDSLTPIDPEYFLPREESTPWGRIRRLKLPYAIDGVSLGFNKPVSRLRSNDAKW